MATSTEHDGPNDWLADLQCRKEDLNFVLNICETKSPNHAVLLLFHFFCNYVKCSRQGGVQTTETRGRILCRSVFPKSAIHGLKMTFMVWPVPCSAKRNWCHHSIEKSETICHTNRLITQNMFICGKCPTARPHSPHST